MAAVQELQVVKKAATAQVEAKQKDDVGDDQGPPPGTPFFFFKQKTAYELSSRDWSSDVCSSDLFAALVFSASPGKSQISPGPLAKAHQSLSGTSQCASCHQFGASTPTFKCLECHKEIARLLSENTGYHARLEMKNPNGKECVRCHLDHNGENFSLIHWEPSKKQFDHRLTGYPLEGKHAGVDCEK